GSFGSSGTLGSSGAETGTPGRLTGGTAGGFECGADGACGPLEGTAGGADTCPPGCEAPLPRFATGFVCRVGAPGLVRVRWVAGVVGRRPIVDEAFARTAAGCAGVDLAAAFGASANGSATASVTTAAAAAILATVAAPSALLIELRKL